MGCLAWPVHPHAQVTVCKGRLRPLKSVFSPVPTIRFARCSNLRFNSVQDAKNAVKGAAQDAKDAVKGEAVHLTAFSQHLNLCFEYAMMTVALVWPVNFSTQLAPLRVVWC